MMLERRSKAGPERLISAPGQAPAGRPASWIADMPVLTEDAPLRAVLPHIGGQNQHLRALEAERSTSCGRSPGRRGRR